MRKFRKKREGKLVELLEGHEGGVNCLGMSADESVLISGSEDSTARMWAIAEENAKDRFLGELT